MLILLSIAIGEHGKELHEEMQICQDLVIIDFGCATGGNSVAILKKILETFPGREKRLVMNDLPKNDWDKVKETLDPIISSKLIIHMSLGKYGSLKHIW